MSNEDCGGKDENDLDVDDEVCDSVTDANPSNGHQEDESEDEIEDEEPDDLPKVYFNASRIFALIFDKIFVLYYTVKLD